MATAAALITDMANRLCARNRGLDIGPAAETIYNVWTELCTFTEAWQITVPISTVAGQQDYVLATAFDLGATMLAVNRVRYPDSLVVLPDNLYEFQPPATLHFRYSSSVSQANNIEARVVMIPIANSPDGVDTTYFPMWSNCIFAGAMAMLMAQRNKPWYDPDQAASYNDQYRLLRVGIRGDANRNGNRRPLRMNCPNVFA